MKVEKFEFNLFGELTYIVWDESTGIGAVVDPGMSTADERRIFDSFIADNNIELKYLLYTHLHIDHTFGHEYIQERYNLPSMANEQDAVHGQYRARQAEMFRLKVGSLQPIVIDRPLRDLDDLVFGSEHLTVITVPGHSQGSVAFYCKESGFVLTGDALFNGSIGRTDLPGGNHEQLIDSIKTRLMRLPDDTIVYPGHGPATTIGAERWSNPFLR